MAKIVPIKYVSRDYNSIREDLLELAKRYYPDTFKDFSESSFGSQMINNLSLIADQLHFYIDYQANESYLDTATEFDNLIKIGKQNGYKFTNSNTSSTKASFYIVIPARANGTPNLDYAPVLKNGSIFGTKDGGRFILVEDVLFDNTNNEIKVARVDENSGTPTHFAIKAKGTVVSGYMDSETITIGEFERFKKIELSQLDIVEIISVLDEEGNEYVEVENLSQNIVYKAIPNRDTEEADLAKSILKPHMVPRRFCVDRELRKTFLQFGASDDVVLPDSDSMVTEPVRVVLNQTGKEYISNFSFDPTQLINSDKFGIAPSNTKITITYRYNSSKNVNYPVNSLTSVITSKVEFRDDSLLSISTKKTAIESLEVDNEEIITGDSVNINSNEIKQKISNVFSTQKRAVTQQDYESVTYNMPSKFGFIKRCRAIKDEQSLKRNINLYVLCEDSNGYLTEANNTVKNNLKTWLTQYKMINDSIDILDGKILNYGINFSVIGAAGKSKFDILNAATQQLRIDFSKVYEIGETFYITDVYTSLKKVSDIVDVVSVEIIEKVGGDYSDARINFKQQISADKRYIQIPKNCVMELKFPKTDIRGAVI